MTFRDNNIMDLLDPLAYVLIFLPFGFMYDCTFGIEKTVFPGLYLFFLSGNSSAIFNLVFYIQNEGLNMLLIITRI